METELLRIQFKILNDRLLKEQNAAGFWSGRLSSSALSTATAIVTFKTYGNSDDDQIIRSGYNWLCRNINTDGGFGDTPESESNVSTSLLCYAAISYCKPDENNAKSTLSSIEKYLESKGILLSSHDVISSVLKFYGKDYTFSVPILSMLTICGVLAQEAVEYIPRLPFELSLLPASYYRFFNLQVVSYAIPALIAVGIYVHTHRKSKLSPGNIYRNRCIVPAIRKLSSIMPESGGFLEAIPLTAFVSMCLIVSNYKDNEVVTKGIMFLKNQQRNDGSWPIDTDLSTWVTTLSIKALGPQLTSILQDDKIKLVKKHLLSVQYKSKHPFNGAKPGGWGWTNFTGSVPDADDTPGAILALLEMYDGSQEIKTAVVNGCKWLLDLQNSDGGFPTFCKGWGRLPFDSSSADLTGHVILALICLLDKVGDDIPEKLKEKIYRCTRKAVSYLQKHQADDGHWLPLWFGNQHSDDKTNPVYGTAKVCTYLEDCLDMRYVPGDLKLQLSAMVSSAQKYLLLQQNTDGSWGGRKNIAGSIEETSLAISALAKTSPEICFKGFDWLLKGENQNNLHPSPIGLYFAALWYDEKMYPLIYYIEALRRFIYK